MESFLHDWVPQLLGTLIGIAVYHQFRPRPRSGRVLLKLPAERIEIEANSVEEVQEALEIARRFQDWESR